MGEEFQDNPPGPADVEQGKPPAESEKPKKKKKARKKDSFSAQKSKRLGHIPEHTFMERISALLAGLSVGSALLALFLARGMWTTPSAMLACILSPYCYWQQTRITDIKGVEETHKALAHEVDKLHEENQRLADTVQELTDVVNRLEDTEGALDEITKTQGQSVQTLIELVEENKRILKRMERNVRAAVLQNIVSILIVSDHDGDFVIGDHEMDEFITRMTRINGVEVFKDKFKQRLASTNGDLEGMLDIIRSVLHDDQNNPDAVFLFHALANPEGI